MGPAHRSKNQTHPTSFAERLRTLRTAARLSKYRLAKRAGITQQSVYQLESSRSLPTWKTVCMLATALGISTEEFRTED
jgi:transcriptional regulator with XRE-family HTH domain